MSKTCMIWELEEGKEYLWVYDNVKFRICNDLLEYLDDSGEWKKSQAEYNQIIKRQFTEVESVNWVNHIGKRVRVKNNEYDLWVGGIFLGYDPCMTHKFEVVFYDSFYNRFSPPHRLSKDYFKYCELMEEN